MITPSRIQLDPREAAQIIAELLMRRPGYVGEWLPSKKGTDAAIVQIFARYLYAILKRLNQAPEKNKLAFLDLLGIQLIPAQSARAPVVFQLSAQATDSRVPAGTRLAAPPPPERTDQIVFETERATGLAAAKLKEIVSLWPGRDQYIDHSTAFLAGQAFQPFKKNELQDTPHIIYIAQDILLALAGKVRLDVEFELVQPSNESLDILWEYWDGKVWRGFKAMNPSCGEEEGKLDGTGGLTRSGRFRLEADCAETSKITLNKASLRVSEQSLESLKSEGIPDDVIEKLENIKDQEITGEANFLDVLKKTIGDQRTEQFKPAILKHVVRGIEAFWIRGRLTEPLPPNPAQVLPEVENIRLQTVITRPPLCTTSEERRVTFDSLIPGTQYGAPAGDKSGDVIFTEDGIPVSVHDFKFTNGGGTFNFCEVGPALPNSGTGQNLQINNINLKFDLTSLDGVVDYVRFEFLDQGGSENISVNDGPIFAGELQSAPVNIAPGVKLTVTKKDEGGEVIITGSVKTLLVGGQEFSLDNVFARLTLSNGFLPDKAFADATALDLSKPFYPLGQQPKPGSVFYFTSEELFSKPNAKAQIFMKTAPTPEQSLNVQPGTDASTTKVALTHKLVWEYWNGKDWVVIPLLPVNDPNNKSDFEYGDVFEFNIPEDMTPSKVNDEEARWVRARLESGGYGFTAKVAWSDATSGTPNEFTYVIPQPPALADFRLCYAWQYGPFHPERVLTYNDFQYEDHTDEAKWPGRTFQPFKPVSDVTPALYLGFDKKLPVDRLNLYFDILEQRGETRGPALLWEYWDGISWRDFSVEDETRHLRIPGLLSFIAPDDSRPLARFGTELHWLRGRLKEDGPPGEPTVNGIFPNAVWTVQQQTITDETIGLSTGQPNQVFTFRQIPVLAGEHIEVRELTGPQANVEWRILAMEIFGGDNKIILELEAMLGKEGSQIDIGKGDLRLRRDRNKRVTEVWLSWQAKKHLFFSGSTDRHYVVERARGRLIFGDGERGKIPPLGASILTRKYRTGGGLVGNVAARTITQLLGGIPGIEAVFNPKPAEGGADGETLEALSIRGPQTIRHRGRALLAEDYETMAKEASPAVAFARAIPSRDPSGRKVPGWVTLLIIPQSEESRPWPSFGLREHVRKFIESHASADLAGANHIYVTGPEYLAIDLEATIIPLDPAEAGAVEKRAREALETFFHPLRGGPNGGGWELGRDVFLSDVASVLERVEGVDYVEEIALLLNGALQRERVRIAEDRIVVAGEIRIKMKQG